MSRKKQIKKIIHAWTTTNIFDRAPAITAHERNYFSNLDNLQPELVIVGVTLPIERQGLRLFPVDAKPVQVVVRQSQPHLYSKPYKT